MKTEYKIFFAIPFDALTKNVYKNISNKLITHFKTQCKLTIIIGNSRISSSSDYSDIMTFRAQNTELHRQFFNEIANSDIIIADLTNNNPNVHIELGVALSLNKNILRVIGRGVNELGFDIQNLDVCKYTDEDTLFDKIKKYLEVFFTIKNLNFSEGYGNLYKKISESISLPGTDAEVNKAGWWFYLIDNFSFRDGAIKLNTKFIHCLNDDSWVGIFFRNAPHIYLGSCLLYIRKNGSMELAEYEFNIKIRYKKLLPNSIDLDKDINLLLEIENNQIKVNVNGENIIIPELKQQRNGGIKLSTYECRASFTNIELVDRDTIEL